MDRWCNRVALVTGASSGIGAAICTLLASNGLKVVAAARRKDRLDSLFQSIGNVHTYQVDLAKDEEVIALFKWIEDNEQLGKLDVCIANAGKSNDVSTNTALSSLIPASSAYEIVEIYCLMYVLQKGMLEEDPEKWRSVVNLNMVSAALCGQLAVNSFLSHKVDDGNVIFINSLSGHRVAAGNPWYTATKFALTALVEGFRREVRALNNGDNFIRVGQISPGLVRTEFQGVKANLDHKDQDEFYDNRPCLEANDVADMVLYMLKAPKHVQIHDMLCRPLKQSV